MDVFRKGWERFICDATRLNVKNAVLVKDGERIGEIHNDQDCLRNAYSGTKSVTSTAVGIAQAEKLLSVEERVVDCFPEELPTVISENLSKLKVKHLLSMTLGQDTPWLMGQIRPIVPENDWVRASLARNFIYEPGTVFQYNNVGPYLAGILVQRRAGMTLAKYMNERFFAPLGIPYPTWEVDRQGNNVGAGGLLVTVEHLLRFGQVYLAQGEWNGRQIVPREWVEAVKSPYPKNQRNTDVDEYSYGFWIDENDDYRFDGKYGQFSVVMESKKAVVAISSEADDNLKYGILESFRKNVYPVL